MIDFTSSVTAARPVLFWILEHPWLWEVWMTLIAECFRRYFLEFIFRGEMLLVPSKTSLLLTWKKNVEKYMKVATWNPYWMSFPVLSNRYSAPTVLPCAAWDCGFAGESWIPLVSVSMFLGHTSQNKIISRDANSFAKLSLICRIVPNNLEFSYNISKPLQTVSTKVSSRLLRCVKA